MFARVYLDPRKATSTSKSAESGNYEDFIVVQCCQLQWFQPRLLGKKNKKQGRITINGCFWHLVRIPPLEMLFLVFNQCSPCQCPIFLNLDWPDLPQALIFSLKDYIVRAKIFVNINGIKNIYKKPSFNYSKLIY